MNLELKLFQMLNLELKITLLDEFRTKNIANVKSCTKNYSSG